MNIFFSKIGHLVNLADWAVVERDCLCGDGGVGGLQLGAGQLQAGRVLPHGDAQALQVEGVWLGGNHWVFKNSETGKSSVLQHILSFFISLKVWIHYEFLIMQFYSALA